MSRETILSDIDDVPDSLLGWNKRQKAVFQKIWVNLQGTDEGEIAEFKEKFFSWMLENVEGMKDGFSKYSFIQEGEIVPDQKLTEVSEKIIGKLDTFIMNSLTEFGLLEGQVRELGKMHLQLHPPITAKHFESFRDNMHMYVEERLGVGAESKECQLWYTFLDAFVKIHEDEREIMGGPSSDPDKKGCCMIV